MSSKRPTQVPLTDLQATKQRLCNCASAATPSGHDLVDLFGVQALRDGEVLRQQKSRTVEREAEQEIAERPEPIGRLTLPPDHGELLKPFGLNARDPTFWQGGLSVIERLIDELAALPAPEGLTHQRDSR